MHHALNPQAEQVIAHFEALNIGGKTVCCPYFNNKKVGVRAGLRVLVGKGSPQEIEEEAKILAIKKRVDLATLGEQALRAFLIDEKLGIDCSAFAYYVLEAEYRARGNALRIRPLSNSPLRRMIAAWRPIENINVKTLAADINSHEIALSEVQAGDLIVLLGTGDAHDLDHVLVVESVDNNTLQYVHSLWWKSDGKYGGRIRHGQIHMTDPTKPLAQQQWEEDGKSDDANETFWRAKGANRLQIRRIGPVA